MDLPPQPNVQLFADSLRAAADEAERFANIPALQQSNQIMEILQQIQVAVANTNNVLATISDRLTSVEQNVVHLQQQGTDLQHQIQQQGEDLQHQIHQQGQDLTNKMLAGHHNATAYSYHIAIRSGNAVLMPFHDPNTNQLIDGFPATVTALNGLHEDEVIRLLRIFGEPLDNRLITLQRKIGILPL